LCQSKIKIMSKSMIMTENLWTRGRGLLY